MEFHPRTGQPQRAVLPLKDQTTVSQAMRETGAFRRFGRIDAVVIRRGPRGIVKMPLKWNASTKSVEPSTNYTLYPGDRLAIYPSENSALDDLLETLGVPAK